MRICLLTTGHRIDDDRIFYKIARSLSKRYLDVWVVAPCEEREPAPRNGVRFVGLPPVSGRLSRIVSLKPLYLAALELRADVYQCTEPETLLVGLLLKRKLGCRLVFDSQEMHAATFSELFPRSQRALAAKLFRGVERQLLRSCDYAFGASWPIADYLVSVLGDPTRVVPLLNCPVPEVFGPVPPRHWGATTIVCHEGWLTFGRGLKQLMGAVALLRDKVPFRFRIVGDLPPEENRWLESFVADHELEGIVEKTGWLDYRDVPSSLLDCHIGVSTYLRTPNNIVTSGNKEFNYMYFGIPFVAPNYRVHVQRMLLQERCGVLVDTTDTGELARAIEGMIRNRERTLDMARKAFVASRSRYLWTHQEEALYRAYDDLI